MNFLIEPRRKFNADRLETMVYQGLIQFIRSIIPKNKKKGTLCPFKLVFYFCFSIYIYFDIYIYAYVYIMLYLYTYICYL